MILTIADDIITNVTSNVITITIALLAVYPVIFIVRNMIKFVSTAFMQIDVKTAFKVPSFTLTNRKKGIEE